MPGIRSGYAGLLDQGWVRPILCNVPTAGRVCLNRSSTLRSAWRATLLYGKPLCLGRAVSSISRSHFSPRLQEAHGCEQANVVHAVCSPGDRPASVHGRPSLSRSSPLLVSRTRGRLQLAHPARSGSTPLRLIIGQCPVQGIGPRVTGVVRGVSVMTSTPMCTRALGATMSS